MVFWRRKKKKAKKSKSGGKDAGKAKSAPRKKERKRTSPLPFEMRMLAVEARGAGMEASEVAELMGVSTTTVHNWSREYLEGGEKALRRKPTSPTHRKICETIQEKIVEHRKAHPEHGIRRIRDELRADEGIEVSAETVRGVVNDADLGNPAPESRGRCPTQRGRSTFSPSSSSGCTVCTWWGSSTTTLATSWAGDCFASRRRRR